MSLFNLINQDKNRQFLQQAVDNEKIANGYLFYGPEGSGFEGFAMEFAAMLNCQSEAEKPCGTCPSCKKMKNLEHGNLSLIFPIPSVPNANDENPITKLTKSEIETIQEVIKSKAGNPYKKLRIERANNIPISLIRFMKKEIYLTAPESGWKIVIVFDADLMKAEAANAFLKILEEPPSKTTIIMTTSNINKILPTIKSRCKPLYFNKLSSNDIHSFLQRKELKEEERQLLINLSAGNMTALNRLLDQDISEIKSFTLDILRTIAGWNKRKIYDTIPKLAKIQKDDKEMFLQILTSINFWFRDAELIRLGITDQDLVHSDQTQTIQKFVDNYPNFQAYEINKVIDNCIDFINRNVYINVALMDMFFQIKKYIGKKK
jgi:DNA polymerase-3 subunit delta'